MDINTFDYFKYLSTQCFVFCCWCTHEAFPKLELKLINNAK